MMTVIGTNARTERCYLLVSGANGLKHLGSLDRCSNECVSSVGLCVKHLAEAHAEYEAIVAAAGNPPASPR